MTDERLFERLTAHAGRVEVDPGFEGRLYALLQSEMRHRSRSSRSTLLLVAALLATLVVASALAIGSGLVQLPWVDGSPTPNPSISASESSEPSPSATASSAPAAWTTTESMSEARAGHTATQLLDGTVLVAGGYRYDSVSLSLVFSTSAELYDPGTGQWTATGSMLEVRAGHTATLLLDGTVLIAGGSNCSDGDGCPVSSAERYDPNTETWTATGAMIGSGPARTATLLEDGRVLVTGGYGPNFEPSPSAELYDPDIGQWTATEAMLDGRSVHTATRLLNGSVLVVGGLPSAEVYDPGTSQWTATGAMAGVRIGHTATLLPGGTVMVAGGMNGTGAMSLTELYYPDSEQWGPTGEMIDGRLNHEATPLADGRVLVTGGVNSVIDAGVPVATVEVYDPSSGQWAVTANWAVTRTGYTTTLLGDGTVLVTGGSDSTGQLASSLVYGPEEAS
jgi:N-acetylneuraminic acid mutarotase